MSDRRGDGTGFSARLRPLITGDIDFLFSSLCLLGGAILSIGLALSKGCGLSEGCGLSDRCGFWEELCGLGLSVTRGLTAAVGLSPLRQLAKVSYMPES